MSLEKLGYYVTHPWVAVMMAIGVVSHGFGMLVGVLDVLGSMAGTWTPLLGMLATLGRFTSFIPHGPAQMLLVGGLAFAFVYKGEQFLNRLFDRLNR